MTLTMEWIGFNALVLVLLALDLFVFNRKAHEIKFKEAMLFSLFWIGLALLFNVFIYFMMGQKLALEFLTGYLIEKALSVDNIFVFIMIFSYFKVDPKYQHGVLFWGIIGALIFRAIFIFAGVALLERFHWLIYVFGGFLVFTGIKMAFQGDAEVHPEKNPVIRLANRLLPVSHAPSDGKMFVTIDGKRFVTPLFIVLLVVETTDIVFAVDSIPAILAISRDPFIVYTSNVFAILGLRALYFALAGVMNMFHLLKYGLAAILAFVGIKMIISGFYKLPIAVALGTVAGILALSIVLSLIYPKKEEKPAAV